MSHPSSLTSCQPKNPAHSFISTLTPGKLMKADASHHKSTFDSPSPFSPWWNGLDRSWLLPNISCYPSRLPFSFFLLCLSNSRFDETHDCLKAFWMSWKSLLWLRPWEPYQEKLRCTLTQAQINEGYHKCLQGEHRTILVIKNCCLQNSYSLKSGWGNTLWALWIILISHN